MSIASNFPAIKPTLLLDFANTEELDSRITFTRASTATYYGTETAKAEENLLLSSQVSTPAWGATNGTISAATQVAPDGTTTAATFTDNTTTGTHIGNQSPVLLAGTIYTMSLFMKAGTSNFGVLTLTNVGTVESGISAVVDLSAGTISQTDTGTSATFTSSSITSVGSGWYRVVITGSSIAGFNRAEFAQAPAATGNVFSTSQRISYTGTGTTIFVWGAQLEQRSAVTAYTPTTTQTITNYIPVLETAASGVARFDHNPTTFESLGLLIEESRANLILQSEDLDTTWAETRATLSLNSVIAPSGALTADVLIASTDNDTHFTSQTFTGTAAAHTFTVYAKAYGLNHVALRLFNGTAQVGLAYYNLSTGATGTVTAGTAAITSVGNGYYRCSLTATLAASASCTADIQLANADNTNSFAGNAFSGVTLWGAQLEAGAFPTSYIPTVASQVTRAADAASMTGTNFSSWYNAAEGTMYAEASVIGATADAVIASANSGTTNNDIRLRVLSSSNSLGFRVFADGVSQAALSTTNAFTVGQEFKSVGVYKVNDFAFSANGLPVTTDTTGVLGVVTQFQLGAVGAVSVLNGHIRKLSYYPLRATNAQLQGLTS